ncbi:hypothetical protein TNIN_221731 [Trichonephila inaurata madagascariensis]|uniref:Uncharacterized protein n=1 Tax=Trichonephila inaurata madagascariensis TaxID=2747483 RepID=A0A8X7CJ59_9ARAC|nr:hypothetical protein TNIN_221731 [Trichonephila inaurata madagascariensis]
MGIASQTIKACAQYFYTKFSRGLMRVGLPRVSLLPGAVLHPLCFHQAAPRSSSIVKNGCWPDASRILQSVVQPTDDVDVGRTARWISTGILPSSS